MKKKYIMPQIEVIIFEPILLNNISVRTPDGSGASGGGNVNGSDPATPIEGDADAKAFNLWDDSENNWDY